MHIHFYLAGLQQNFQEVILCKYNLINKYSLLQKTLTIEMPLTCPLCNLRVNDEVALIQHFSLQHQQQNQQQQQKPQQQQQQQQQQILQQQQHQQQQGYKPGDRVFAMWAGAMWNYFPGSVSKRISENKYEINWDDGDQSGIFHNFFYALLYNAFQVHRQTDESHKEYNSISLCFIFAVCFCIHMYAE